MHLLEEYLSCSQASVLSPEKISAIRLKSPLSKKSAPGKSFSVSGVPGPSRKRNGGFVSAPGLEAAVEHPGSAAAVHIEGELAEHVRAGGGNGDPGDEIRAGLELDGDAGRAGADDVMVHGSGMGGGIRGGGELADGQRQLTGTGVVQDNIIAGPTDVADGERLAAERDGRAFQEAGEGSRNRVRIVVFDEQEIRSGGGNVGESGDERGRREIDRAGDLEVSVGGAAGEGGEHLGGGGGGGEVFGFEIIEKHFPGERDVANAADSGEGAAGTYRAGSGLRIVDRHLAIIDNGVSGVGIGGVQDKISTAGFYKAGGEVADGGADFEIAAGADIEGSGGAARGEFAEDRIVAEAADDGEIGTQGEQAAAVRDEDAALGETEGADLFERVVDIQSAAGTEGDDGGIRDLFIGIRVGDTAAGDGQRAGKTVQSVRFREVKRAALDGRGAGVGIRPVPIESDIAIGGEPTRALDYGVDQHGSIRGEAAGGIEHDGQGAGDLRAPAVIAIGHEKIIPGGPAEGEGSGIRTAEGVAPARDLELANDQSHHVINGLLGGGIGRKEERGVGLGGTGRAP